MASPAMPFDYGSLFGYPSPSQYPMYGNPYSGMNVDWSQGDPAYAMKQNRGYFANWGQNMNTSLNGQQQQAQQFGQQYQQAADREAASIGNTPGWTQDEMSSIVDPQAWQGGMTTQDQFDSLNPTQGETQGMMGDPSSYGFYFQGAPGQLASNEQNSASQEDSAIQSETQQAGTTFGQEGNTINSLFSNPNLSPSTDYYNKMASITDPSKLNLNLDPSYMMSDKEVQQMQDQAGQVVQGKEQTRLQNIQQRMAASGNTDPLAFAALSRESQGESNKDATDAVTQAQIEAEDAQRQTKMNYAQAKMSAAQSAAGIEMTGAQEAENTGLGAAQWNTQGQLGASMNLGEQELQQGQWAGGQSTSMASQNAQMYQQAIQYAASTGTSIQEAMDQVSAQRASQQYGIRQGNSMYGQQQRFNQNYMTQQQLAQMRMQGANARMQGQNTFLNWGTGMYGKQADMGMGLNQQQIGVGQTMFPQMNQATGQWGNYAVDMSGQSFGSQFARGFGQALGGGIGKGVTGAAWGGG